MIYTPVTELRIRRDLRPGEDAAIVALQERVYGSEHGLGAGFTESLARSVQAAIARGWPERSGGLWVVERERDLEGCIALTDEGGGVGQVRWFVLSPELRGRGLGRTLLGELLATARAAGMQRLELRTFSALTAAARLYREAGFRIESSHQTDEWGPLIILQRYELQLR